MQLGFSLVELSIVLVILGLLVGGILAGQSLIRAAELRAVSTEANRWMAAAQTFRDKYFAIPGDMANATSFWGDDNLACPDPAVPNGTPGTCNGDGNFAFGLAAVNGGTSEMHQLWKQLALAGLIEGSYSGLAAAGTNNGSQSGVNVPRSKLNQGLWNFQTFSQSGHPAFTDGDYGNVLFVGAALGNTSAYGKLMRPEEAWNIDTKTDDGRPQQGKVWAVHWDDCTTAANSTTVNADYALTVSSAECALAFRSVL